MLQGLILDARQALVDADALEIQCPACKAEPQALCFVNAPERISIRAHEERVWAATRAAFDAVMERAGT